MNIIIGLKELRENVNNYAAEVKKGKSFIVVRKSKPLFKISSSEEVDLWEPVIDFTRIRKGGLALNEILSRL